MAQAIIWRRLQHNPDHSMPPVQGSLPLGPGRLRIAVTAKSRRGHGAAYHEGAQHYPSHPVTAPSRGLGAVTARPRRSLGTQELAAEGGPARVAVEGAVGDGELVPRPDPRRADSDNDPAAEEGRGEAGGPARVVEKAGSLVCV